VRSNPATRAAPKLLVGVGETMSRIWHDPPIPSALPVHQTGIVMLKWAIIFGIVALIAGALGFTGVAGAAAGIAKFLFFLFLVIVVALLIAGFFAGKKVTGR
jgi:uncharacterized membrane protein YtjA (UPF0391 family)